MNEAVATIIVAGAVQVVGMVVGFLTLWLKVKYGVERAEDAAAAAAIVEAKLDANTATTNSVDTKASTIVQQTNGSLVYIKDLVESIAERVAKLEEHSRETSNRTLESLTAKVERILAIKEGRAVPPATAKECGNFVPTTSGGYPIAGGEK